MQLQLCLLGAGNVLGRTLKYKRAEENYLKAFDLDISCVILFNSFHITFRSEQPTSLICTDHCKLYLLLEIFNVPIRLYHEPKNSTDWSLKF
jgi:hypothetical protein